MLSKNNIQHIKSLHLKKFRESFGQFIVEGPKLVYELLESQFVIKSIYATSEWRRENVTKYNTKVEIVEVSQLELKRISGFKTPNQVLAIANIPPNNALDNSMPNTWMLMLDGISDPGNLGTIIRTADWFGIRKIICSEDTVENVNPKVVQASMGSIFRVEIYYTNLNNFLEKLKPDFPVYGTFMDGKNIYSENFPGAGLLVMGSESHGIRSLVEKKVNNRLHIPKDHSRAESLNVSVATAICCSEIIRSELKNI